MSASLDLQLDRLKELIARVGPEPLFAAPLVTPEDAWFPDPWSPDLECVRRILLRMAEYAGLEHLDVEVTGFPEETAETRIPDTLRDQQSAGASGLFYGIREGCAWFGIDENHLRTPELLIGVLAHEMAHAWREDRGVHVTPNLAEEECTDLTTIVLGFGILLCNTAYQFRPEAAGVRPNFGHFEMGYLDLPDLTGLLACWALLKGLPRDEFPRHFASTQAAEFGAAWDRLAGIDLLDRLGIAAIPEIGLEERAGASHREFTPSRAARDAHDCMKRLVELAGEQGGLLKEPIPFPARVIALPHRVLATWGRITAAEIWTRSLALVSDPEWDMQAIVLVTQTRIEFARYTLGHVRDRQARDGRFIRGLLHDLFETGSAFRTLLVPSLPTHVSAAVGAQVLGDRELEPYFRSIAKEADADQVVSETEWLLEHRTHTTMRLDRERVQGGIPRIPSTGTANTGRWWEAVTGPDHVRDEVNDVKWYAANVRSKSPVEWSAPEAPDPGST